MEWPNNSSIYNKNKEFAFILKTLCSKSRKLPRIARKLKIIIKEI